MNRHVFLNLRFTFYLVFCILYSVFCILPLYAANPYAGKFYSDGSPKKAEFALTYDDGPGYITESLLALLEHYDARATFFMTGYSVRKYPGLAAKVAAAGHLIGNHTDKHEFYPKIGKSPDREKILEKELDNGAAAIEKAAGKKTVFLRMPNGYGGDWVRKVAAAKGYILVSWTYGSDWTNISDEKMAAGYLSHLKPGAILLMHDGGGQSREKTLRITEKILLEAKKKGLKPVGLDTLLDIKPVNSDNIVK